MNVPRFSAEASVYNGRSYTSPKPSSHAPGDVVLQAPNQPGTGTGGGGSPSLGPSWPQSGPCECWKQCVKSATTSTGQTNCNRLFHFAKCLNEEPPFANCYGIAQDQWSKPFC